MICIEREDRGKERGRERVRGREREREREREVRCPSTTEQHEIFKPI